MRKQTYTYKNIDTKIFIYSESFVIVGSFHFIGTGEAPVGRGPTRKILSVKEVKQVQEDKQRLTEHFIQTLPLLLDKYRVDPEKLANLLAIPQYFDLDIYTKSRQEQNLDSLLKKIHTIVEISHDTEVLDTAAKTLEHMCVDGYAIFRRYMINVFSMTGKLYLCSNLRIHRYILSGVITITITAKNIIITIIIIPIKSKKIIRHTF